MKCTTFRRPYLLLFSGKLEALLKWIETDSLLRDYLGRLKNAQNLNDYDRHRVSTNTDVMGHKKYLVPALFL